MHIVIVSRGYPTEKYKLNGIFEFDQAKALVAAGNTVSYIALDMRSIKKSRNFGIESFVKDGVNIEAINIPCGRVPSVLLEKISLLALKKMYKIVTRKQGIPDIIHAHFLHIGYIVAQGFSKSSIPLVLTEHFSGVNQDVIDSALIKKGLRTYNEVDEVITVSNYLARNIQRNFDVNTIVVPNIFDSSKFKFDIKSKNNDNFDFISVGSLTDNKRMSLLIESFEQAFNRNSRIRLFIYGDGPERNMLKEFIRIRKLSNCVFLMGQVDRSEISNKMKSSKCFVLISKLETFGVAYIEAMALGLPVIATKSGGPNDFVSKYNGLLIDNNQNLKQNLIDSLKYMYKNNELYNSNDISKGIVEKFAPKTISNELLNIYKGLIINKGNEENA